MDHSFIRNDAVLGNAVRCVMRSKIMFILKQLTAMLAVYPINLSITSIVQVQKILQPVLNSALKQVTRSKAVLIGLSTCFTITCAINITAVMFVFAFGPNLESTFTMLNINICQQDTTSLRWAYPATSMAVLTFDTILCAFALHHAIRHLSPSFWNRPVQAATSIGAVIVRDNLTYFLFDITAFSALMCYTLSAMAFAPSIANITAFIVINSIMESILLALIGPWLLVSLRKSFELTTGAEVSASQEVTTVAFASVPPIRSVGYMFEDATFQQL
ncbi:hypothetical protein CONPUDRAFT_70613 [Coniophora puteana RWD-64-598 SS2]|uniref:Uncharacterized protein n=1 Tax=Coniophora puteana (strain RWD-64-598) TaxID=741705 RepID=A0A5M3MWX1_CONPW|nr:uncharacterized protein CONPUDRAFT_70613 [Coniophora puteana RWD-64-598 SS2]EIW83638.1 hypothetical protein CONPUDRAFT_70613 [Coniophora puteana RWD-64-598 SS2]